MNRIVTAIIILSTLFFTLLSCSENNDNNPVGPVDETYTISGKVAKIDFSYYGLENVEITFTGNDTETTITTDKFGEFSLKNLPNGNYTIKPYKDEYKFGPAEMNILIDNYNCTDAEFLAIQMEKYEFTIAGRVVDSEGNPVYSACIDVYNLYGDYLTSCTNTNGYYCFYYRDETLPFIEEESYTVIPRHSYDNYTFSPDTCFVTTKENITICNFTGEYTGPPLHTITGRMVDYNGEGIYKLFVELKKELTLISYLYTDKNGLYNFYGLNDGSYVLTIESSDYILAQDSIYVNVEGNDVVIEDIRAWDNYTNYTISGKITNTEDKGISGVSVDVFRLGFFSNDLEHELTSNTYGLFSCEVSVTRNDAESTFRIIPYKEGLIFSPESTEVTLQWIDWDTQGDTVHVEFEAEELK
ncbi:MAG: carboxypeptidase regulatory-like domain-containing protein [Candidatus Latescibacteria bacterium]|nr:carboxypeptidase regulatory-like domain-containing protein [Candidatus Latescibacterota bacterium]